MRLKQEPIIVLSESDGRKSRNKSITTTAFDVDILGETVHICFGINSEEARLADIVPPAQVVCTKIIDVVVQKIHEQSANIPCRQGCCTCCRYIVPLSVAEAFWLRERIFAKPETQQKMILGSCLSAAVRIIGKKMPKSIAEITSKGLIDKVAIANWYKSLQLDCPFLYKGICLIYEQRPLVCREHFVIGTAGTCKNKRHKARSVMLPVQVSRVLSQLASKLEGMEEEAAVVPLALSWCEENIDRSKHTWPTIVMVEYFIELMKEMASMSACRSSTIEYS